MRLIKLTLHSRKIPVYINVEAVASFCDFKGKTQLTLRESAGLYYEVDETVDAIARMCGTITKMPEIEAL